MIMTSLASRGVAATNAILRVPSSTHSRTHSAPERPLPPPLPPITYQIVQSPRGLTCSGRAQPRHAYLSATNWAVVNRFSSRFRTAGGSDASETARELVKKGRAVCDFDRAALLACKFDTLNVSSVFRLAFK